MQKKVLITGSTGFIGRHLVPKLIGNNFQILEITRSIEKSTQLFGDSTSKVQVSDALFKEKIKKFDPEIVIHLASYLTSSDELSHVEKLIESNLLFLAKVLDSISETNLKLFINTGTFAEYFKGGDELIPAYFYAATKTASRSLIEYYSNTYNFIYTNVIPYTIYGGNDSNKKILDLIKDSLDSREALDLSPGEQILDFIHINDVIDFYYKLLLNYSKIKNKSVFKLGTGKGHTLKEVASIIQDLTSKRVNINWGGKKYRKSDVMYAVADTSDAYNLLNWKPKISLNDGIKKYVEINS